MFKKQIPLAMGLFFDTETTGIPIWNEPSHRAAQPHLTQIGAIVADLNTKEIIHTVDLIVKPDGWEIPPECYELNGITTEYAAAVGVPEKYALEVFTEIARTGGYNFIPRFAFNTTFDNRIIRIALSRYNKAIAEMWKEAPYECMMQASRKHLGAKSIKLIDAYREICGKDLQDAHTAIADARACMEIYFELNGYFELDGIESPQLNGIEPPQADAQADLTSDLFK